jgi:hypothetical protein
MTWPTILTIGTFGERMDLRIKQGSSFGPMRFEMVNPDDTPVDLSNCVIRSQIRQDALDATVVADITCDITNPMLGKFEISLTDEQTQVIEAGESIGDPESRYVWDMELEDGSGRVIPLYHGQVIVLREVTR